jgi:hypothetical protein
LEGTHIVDMAGNRIWWIDVDGLHSVESGETIGYFSSSSPDIR